MDSKDLVKAIFGKDDSPVKLTDDKSISSRRKVGCKKSWSAWTRSLRPYQALPTGFSASD